MRLKTHFNDKSANNAAAKEAAKQARETLSDDEACVYMAAKTPPPSQNDTENLIQFLQGDYLAYAQLCGSIGIFTAGITADELKANIDKAMNTYLAAAKAAGEQPEPISKGEILARVADFKAALAKRNGDN